MNIATQINPLEYEVAYQTKKTNSQAHGNSKKQRVGARKSSSTMSMQHKGPLQLVKLLGPNIKQAYVFKVSQ